LIENPFGGMLDIVAISFGPNFFSFWNCNFKNGLRPSDQSLLGWVFFLNLTKLTELHHQIYFGNIIGIKKFKNLAYLVISNSLPEFDLVHDGFELI